MAVTLGGHMARYASLQERLMHYTVQKDGGRLSELDLATRLCCLWCGFKIGANKVQGYGEEFIGYGRIGIHDPRVNSSRKLSTHRVAYVLHSLKCRDINFDSSDPDHMLLLFVILDAYKYLYYKENLTLDHRCVDPRCWNPHHVQWTTIQQNLFRRETYKNKTSPSSVKPIKSRKRLPRIDAPLSQAARGVVYDLVLLARTESQNSK